MCISGFTLAYAYRDRPINYRTFVARRAWRVALPYLVWSGIYLIVFPPDGMNSAAGFISVILYGTAFYHLYFVVVSVQWYVIFPFVLPLANRLRGRAAAVATGAVLALSLGVAAWFTAGASLPAWASPLNRVLPHWDALLVSYLGYYLLGTLGGIHAEGVLSWLRRHLWLVAAAMAGLLGYLMLDVVQDGFAHYSESIDIFRPAMVLYGLAGSGLLLACAGQITRAGGKAYTWLLAISGNSFPIYLAHPLILYLVESYILSQVHSYSPILSAPLILVAFLVPHGLSILVKSTPLAPVLLGQGSWRHPRRADRVRPVWAEQLPSHGD
ncbi:MAG: acyltransferase 3 [Firmicutes bacterium]|nr:acyltransferase 3 [Bacillota bacterium]